MACILEPLRDVVGVRGSFACTNAGNLLLADWPDISPEALRVAAANLVSLLAVGRDAVSDCGRMTYRFEGAQLEVLALPSGLLCAVVDEEHDGRMLQTVMRLIGRRVLRGRVPEPN